MTTSQNPNSDGPPPGDSNADSAPRPDFDATRKAPVQSQGSASADRPHWSASVVETLVRFDEAAVYEVESLELDPLSRGALERLRAVDQFLESGGLRSTPGLPQPAISSANLFSYAQGELDGPSADIVEAHLRENAVEAGWVESLQRSAPPSPLHWIEEPPEAEHPPELGSGPIPEPALAEPSAVPAPALRLVPSESTGDKKPSGPFPGWLAWTPLAAAALILAMAIGGGGRRSVLDGGLPDSPVLRSAHAEALLFPRGRVVASTDAVETYASQPLFEVTPVANATEYSFALREVTGASAFEEGDLFWKSTSASSSATAPSLVPGSYTWTATALVNGLDRSLGSLSFTVVPATAMDRALFIRAASSSRDTMPGILREDIRRLHASGFLTDARCKARALPPGDERDAYLAVPVPE